MLKKLTPISSSCSYKLQCKLEASRYLNALVSNDIVIRNIAGFILVIYELKEDVGQEQFTVLAVKNGGIKIIGPHPLADG